MKRYIAGLTTALMLFGGSATAQNVTTVGVGMTASDAENNALRRAVENTVGVLVDSQTLVNKNVLISDKIYTQSRGFITNYTVRNRQQTINGWEVTINADVDDNPNSRLMNELTRLGIIDHRLRNPKVAVYIPEQSLGYRLPDPAGETAVIKSLVEAGFTNVVASGSTSGYGWPGKSYHQMSLADMRDAACFLGADILIVGEAFSENVGDVGAYLPNRPRTGMESCRARVEAKMYIAQTGQIIAADGKYGSGADISRAVASKKALAIAGQHMGDYFVEQLLNTGAGNRQSLEIVVIGSDFSQVNAVQTALEHLHGVQGSQLARYEGGTGLLRVRYNGSPHSLFAALQKTAAADLTLESISYNTITLRAY